MRSLACAFALLLLICNSPIARAQDADQQTARGYIEMLRTNQLAEIERNADPSLKAADVHAVLIKMAAEFPAEDPKSVKVISVRTGKVTASDGVAAARTDFTFEYRFPSGPVLSNISLQKTGAVTTIIAFNAARVPAGFNDFTLAGRSGLQYLVLALAMLIPAFTLYTLVLCYRTVHHKWKWLWMAAIAISLGQFSIDWVAGVWTLQPLSLLLFSVAAARSLGGYGPWVISIGFPAAAIVFHIWHKMRGQAYAPPARAS